MAFPVGYRSLHPDTSLNFQMNRWFGWVGEPEMLDEMRDAGYEVIAFDILTDFSDVVLRQTHPLLRRLLKGLLQLGASGIVNRMVARVARTSPVVEWGVQEGMHVTGSRSAFEFLRCVEQFQTADVSASVRQDAPLLGGSEDHYVPVQQWHQQIRILANARSVTARLFTREESAQNHCQAGNYGLALRIIVNWLDAMLIERAQPLNYHEGVCE